MMKLHNTYSNQLEEFKPIDGNKVKMYVCGPTVYDYAHLGHARCYITWDVLYRYLKFKGYDVTYCRNVTDVDDKILKKAEKEGKTPEEVSKLTAKHFIAVTDKNAEKSELRRTSIESGWLGDLFIHDDVGGRFSAFDDHALFALAFAGMKKEDMASMLRSAQEVSELSLSSDLELNDALKEGIFWADAKMNGIKASVHQYMGSIFENTVYWHAQMQNESQKDTLKQVAKVPDAMHHSAEAHFNPANKLVFALTVPMDNGVCASNAEAYIGALTKSYEVTGAFFREDLKTSKLGLTPEAAGAVTQLRAFATVYQEIVETVMQGKQLPEVFDSVLQPHVEFYKKNLKGGVVVPGRVG